MNVRRPAGSSAPAGRGSARARRGGSVRIRRAAARPASPCRATGGRGRCGRRRRRRSGAGSSSRRTARVVSGRGPNHCWRKPRSPLRSAYVPAVTTTCDARASRRARPAAGSTRASASTRRSAPRRGRAEQAGERRAEDDRRARPRRRRRAAARPAAARRAARASPTTSIMVASAARSCSPRKDAWRLPATLTKPTAPQTTATTV